MLQRLSVQFNSAVVPSGSDIFLIHYRYALVVIRGFRSAFFRPELEVVSSSSHL